MSSLTVESTGEDEKKKLRCEKKERRTKDVLGSKAKEEDKFIF